MTQLFNLFSMATLTTAAVLAAGCASQPEPTPEPPVRIGMPNPASKYCIDKGGKLSFQKDAAGNSTGLCALPDGTVVEEWALYRRDHPAK